MHSGLIELEKILSLERLTKMRDNGAVFFDVDDTLLARRRTSFENDQTFSESAAAILIPQLLIAGVRVCLITGHGWNQLKRRLVLPLIGDVSKKFSQKRNELFERFFIYANRGATKLVWKTNNYKEDKIYGREFALDTVESTALRGIFTSLTEILIEDFERRESLYKQTFPNFAFDELPPKIIEREKVVLSLRPIPSRTHSNVTVSESPRRKLFLVGLDLLKKTKLNGKYELEESGKSTLEITKKGISKKNAFQDMIFEIAKQKKITPELVESSSIYVGDEFSINGNDYTIATNFLHTLCFSVAREKEKKIPENVFLLRDYCQKEGVFATASLIDYILKFLT